MGSGRLRGYHPQPMDFRPRQRRGTFAWQPDTFGSSRLGAPLEVDGVPVAEDDDADGPADGHDRASRRATRTAIITALWSSSS